MRLVDVKIGEVVRMTGYAGGKMDARLEQAGIFPDDRIRVLRAAPLDGPLLIEVGGREIALGRQVARRIRVEIE